MHVLIGIFCTLVRLLEDGRLKMEFSSQKTINILDLNLLVSNLEGKEQLLSSFLVILR